MKTQREEKLVVIIGRNRRVYARVYKLESYIPAFIGHCTQKEGEKSAREGFFIGKVELESSDGKTMVYRCHYEPMPEPVAQAYRERYELERRAREREEMRRRRVYAGF